LPPASSVLQISVIGDQWITVMSAPVKMTARLITSTAPLEYVDGSDGVTWSVEPPGIATIDRAGLVTPIASGSARVIATYGDQQGVNNVRVLPDFTGTWSGTYRITSCSGHYDFRLCGRMTTSIIDGSPNRYPFTLVLSQTRDQVNGTLEERDRSTPLTGIVRESGILVLEASVPQPGLEPLRITNWSSTTNAANTQLSGAFTKLVTALAPFGSPYTVRTEHEFSNITRGQ
jgi:hypothetical protein